MTRSNYFILLALALIFITPGIAAYLSFLHPQWISASKTNKGTLLSPPVLFSDLPQNKLKWRFVYWYPENCETLCLEEVDKLAKVRLALGRHLYEVDEWLVLPETSQQEKLANGLKENDIQVLGLTKNRIYDLPILGQKPAIFIANPDGYLVLVYASDVKPQAIFHDIKQLLKKNA